MQAAEVLELLAHWEDASIDVVIDGGWGVDALLGCQTRIHADLDIALDERHLARFRGVMVDRGYQDVSTVDASAANFVMQDSGGRRVDLHVYSFDDGQEVSRGVAYPREALSGRGSIRGRDVRCISPQAAVLFRTRYVPAAKDVADVQALCAAFAIPVPTSYQQRDTIDR